MEYFVRQALPPVDVPAPLDPRDLHKWSCRDVSRFFEHHGFEVEAKTVYENEVDGCALGYLKPEHLVSTLDMKLGPSLKMVDLVARLLSPDLGKTVR